MLIDVSAIDIIDIIYVNRDFLSSSWKFQFIILRQTRTQSLLGGAQRIVGKTE